MSFQLLSPIESRAVIAVGSKIRTLKEIQRRFGRGRWRKLKGVATIRNDAGQVRRAELHWYEAHGVGRVLMKIKQYVD